MEPALIDAASFSKPLHSEPVEFYRALLSSLER
jgi:hypothetical protein